MPILRYWLLPLTLAKPLVNLTLTSSRVLFRRNTSRSSCPFLRRSRKLSSALEGGAAAASPSPRNVSTDSLPFLSGLDDVLKGYVCGQKKATEVSHLLWKQLVQKGDTVVDATCGNGNDTLVLAKLAIDDLAKGYVYGMDVQEDAIKNTSSLLELSLDPIKRRSVELFSICHSKIAEVIPKNSSLRLVAFNLGYLPGADKTIITKSDTTLLALTASKELLTPGGVISVVAYVGHPGGREEYETVRAFASELPTESWVCSEIHMLNRPLAPVLVFLFKR